MEFCYSCNLVSEVEQNCNGNRVEEPRHVYGTLVKVSIAIKKEKWYLTVILVPFYGCEALALPNTPHRNTQIIITLYTKDFKKLFNVHQTMETKMLFTKEEIKWMKWDRLRVKETSCISCRSHRNAFVTMRLFTIDGNTS